MFQDKFYFHIAHKEGTFKIYIKTLMIYVQILQIFEYVVLFLDPKLPNKSAVRFSFSNSESEFVCEVPFRTQNFVILSTQFSFKYKFACSVQEISF
jgi:hypothetical protein